MSDYIHNIMWYTVWDAKTGDLVASGTAAMCARRLGYSSSGSFASAVSHWLCDGRQHVKYTIQREYIPRSEVDSLPQRRKYKKTKSPPVLEHRRAARDDGCRMSKTLSYASQFIGSTKDK